MMHIALRRRLGLPLPLAARRCVVDEHGDHALACPRTGLGQVVPQQWLDHTRTVDAWTSSSTGRPVGRGALLRCHARLAAGEGWHAALWCRRTRWGRALHGRAAQTSHLPRTRTGQRATPLRARLRGWGALERRGCASGCRAPAPLRAAAGIAWARRWWSAPAGGRLNGAGEGKGSSGAGARQLADPGGRPR